MIYDYKVALLDLSKVTIFTDLQNQMIAFSTELDRYSQQGWELVSFDWGGKYPLCVFKKNRQPNQTN